MRPREKGLSEFSLSALTVLMEENFPGAEEQHPRGAGLANQGLINANDGELKAL